MIVCVKMRYLKQMIKECFKYFFMINFGICMFGSEFEEDEIQNQSPDSYLTDEQDHAVVQDMDPATIYEDMGYDHPLGELIKYLISATKTKDNEKVYTSFRGDKMFDIIEYLNGDKDE